MSISEIHHVAHIREYIGSFVENALVTGKCLVVVVYLGDSLIGCRCDLVSTLCKYDLRKGDLFVLRWARE